MRTISSKLPFHSFIHKPAGTIYPLDIGIAVYPHNNRLRKIPEKKLH